MMLYRCDRMLITSMHSVCAVNRKAVDMRCNGCAGETIIESEVGIMSTLCNYKGCKKTQVFKGFCTEHVKAEGLYEKFQAHKALKKANEKFIEKQKEEVAKKAACITDVRPLTFVLEDDPVPVVTQAEIEECDEICYLRNLLEDTLDAWAVDLAKTSNIKRRAEYFLNMCRAAEALGHCG